MWIYCFLPQKSDAAFSADISEGVLKLLTAPVVINRFFLNSACAITASSIEANNTEALSSILCVERNQIQTSVRNPHTPQRESIQVQAGEHKHAGLCSPHRQRLGFGSWVTLTWRRKEQPHQINRNLLCHHKDAGLTSQPHPPHLKPPSL